MALVRVPFNVTNNTAVLKAAAVGKKHRLRAIVISSADADVAVTITGKTSSDFPLVVTEQLALPDNETGWYETDANAALSIAVVTSAIKGIALIDTK